MTKTEACEQIGIIDKDVPADGKPHPTAVAGKDPRNTSGRIKLFLDGAGGIVMNNFSCETLVFFYDGKPKPRTKADKAAQAEHIARGKKELEDSQQQCREKSKHIWENVAREEIPADHQYLIAKGIRPFGLRWQSSGNLIVVPVRSLDKTLHGIQYIQPDGSKKFKTDTVKIGHFHLIGKPVDHTMVIAEGYATAASIHECTGHAVLVAFDAGNLKAVAEVVRNKYPTWTIIIAADNDKWFKEKKDDGSVIYHEVPCVVNGVKRINTGVAKASEAAKSVNGSVRTPQFTNLESHPTDFNDLHALEGIDVVISQFAAVPADFEPEEFGKNVDTAQLKIATKKRVEKLNEKYFVSCEGGKTSVYAEAWEERMSRNVLNRSSFVDFKNYYLNILIFSHEDKHGQPVFKPLGEVWVSHTDRRQYEGITLDPGKDTPGSYNLWRGFSVEPVAGSARWRRMRHHIFEIICSSNQLHYDYVMGWLATVIQLPGKQAEVALVLKGKRGTGKGTIGNYMCKLFGGNSAHIFSSKHLTGNFNAHLRDVVFLFADEAFWAGDKQGESTLKGLVTEPTLLIEGKGKDAVTVKNMLHILMASNNDWVIPAGLEERRFCVLDVSDKVMQQESYFKPLYEEMESGGLAAMLYDLQHYDLGQYSIRNVPQSAGLLEQKLHSLDDFSQWWLRLLHEGELVSDSGWNIVPIDKLYDSYIAEMTDRAISRRAGLITLGLAFKKVLPPGWPKRIRRNTEPTSPVYGDIKRIWCYTFPPIEMCRGQFQKTIGHEIEWDDIEPVS